MRTDVGCKGLKMNCPAKGMTKNDVNGVNDKKTLNSQWLFVP